MATLAFRRAHLAGIARDLASQQLARAAYQMGRGSAPARADLPPGCDRGAAFVSHCMCAAGLSLAPWSVPGGPDAPAIASAWISWATASDIACYYPVGVDGFVPDVGDLIVFADHRKHSPQGHIGVIIDQTEHAFITAEGNVKNRTGIVVRRKGRHIHGFILLLEGDEAPTEVLAARIQYQQARAATRHGYGGGFGARTLGVTSRVRRR